MRRLHVIAAGILLIAVAQPAMAQKKYGPGVSDTEIKLGQTMPYSGPASPIGVIGKMESAYFKMINAQGGVNGRKINLISLDDGFSPSKTVEQTRSLVEGEEVLAIVSTLGSATNIAIAKYLNQKKVPQILLPAGSPKLIDPVNLPWTTTFYSPFEMEGKLFAAYLLRTKPNAKLGIIYQNDEGGRIYLEAMKAGLGDKAASIVVKEVSFDSGAPTIDSQILLLQAAGADTIFFAMVAPKYGAQGLRKIGELGWKPLILLVPAVSTIESTLKPAGVTPAIGAITSAFMKAPDDSKWADDPAVKDYLAFMKEWAPGQPTAESQALFGYVIAQMAVEVLKRCGDDLTRENVLYHATHIKDWQVPMFIPGIKVNISPENRIPWRAVQMQRFNGTGYESIGDLVSIEEK
jgi:ABC-type branched-subunit amino acid transport system substrate-binding protein